MSALSLVWSDGLASASASTAQATSGETVLSSTEIAATVAGAAPDGSSPGEAQATAGEITATDNGVVASAIEESSNLVDVQVATEQGRLQAAIEMTLGPDLTSAELMDDGSVVLIGVNGGRAVVQTLPGGGTRIQTVISDLT